MSKYPKEQRELIEAAFMAGQADTGVDPSYSNAQRYVDELEKPKPVFKVREVVVSVVSGNTVHWRETLAADYRYLNLEKSW